MVRPAPQPGDLGDLGLQLLRHHWVTVKLVIGLVALTLVTLPLRIQLHTAATAVQKTGATGDIGFVQSMLIIVPSLALVLYSANVVLSIFKPWGMSAYGRRRRAGRGRRIEALTAIDSRRDGN